MNIVFIDKTTEEYVEFLERPIRIKVLRGIDLLERYGNTLGMPHSKALGDGLFELRTYGSPPLRVIYCFYRENVVLLHCFEKKTEKIAMRDLRCAQDKYRKLVQK